jgi:hypothetical protein
MYTSGRGEAFFEVKLSLPGIHVQEHSLVVRDIKIRVIFSEM